MLKKFLHKKILKIEISSWIGFFSRMALGGVFLLASIGKVSDISSFQKSVESYNMLPLFITPIFSFLLAWSELVVGIYLIFGLFVKQTTYVTIILLIIFMIAISYALITSQPVSGCGCFGTFVRETISWIDIVRDLLFILLAITILKTKPIFVFDGYLKRSSN